jgi:hypothetical protein
MTRILKPCLIGSALVALTLVANSSNAGSLNIHTTTPTVNVPKMNLPKVNTPKGSSSVLVGFAHGDPDKPYVTGNVYNGKPTTIGGATGGAGTGKSQFGDFQINKKIDSSSPVLFKNVAPGSHFKGGAKCSAC